MKTLTLKETILTSDVAGNGGDCYCDGEIHMKAPNEDICKSRCCVSTSYRTYKFVPAFKDPAKYHEKDCPDVQLLRKESWWFQSSS